MTSTEITILIMMAVVVIVLIVLCEIVVSKNNQLRQTRCQVEELRQEIVNKDDIITEQRRQMAGLDKRNEELLVQVLRGEKALGLMLHDKIRQREIAVPIFNDSIAALEPGLKEKSN